MTAGSATAGAAVCIEAPSRGVGTELVVELWSPKAAALGDVKAIRRLILRAARRSGSTVVSSFFYADDGGGVSGYALLKESHVSIHTRPQDGYAAIDFFTCGKADGYKAVEEIERALQPKTLAVTQLDRGCPTQ